MTGASRKSCSMPGSSSQPCGDAPPHPPEPLLDPLPTIPTHYPTTSPDSPLRRQMRPRKQSIAPVPRLPIVVLAADHALVPGSSSRHVCDNDAPAGRGQDSHASRLHAIRPSLVPVLIYHTGPNRLLPRDIPGYRPPPGQQAVDDDGDGDYQPDTWAWFRKHEATGTYRFLAEGMTTVAGAIRGFSQGGAMAAVVTAALEPDRPVPEGSDGSWALALRDANAGRPLKFSVSCSGFFGPVDALKWCYEPKLKTPTLHYVGSLDTVVDESRTQALIDRCQDPMVVVHPGGHHVPVAKEWATPLAGFITARTGAAAQIRVMMVPLATSKFPKE